MLIFEKKEISFVNCRNKNKKIKLMKQKNKKWQYPLIAMGLILMLAISCKKDEKKDETPVTPTVPTAGVPVLSTTASNNIAQTTATCGGNITSDAGATITARGVCWSTGQTPTIIDNKTTDGTGIGVFTSSITGLTANTTYYARAYATNSNGTGYGSVISFKTLTSGATGTVTDADGNIYNTVTIGTQTWMVENLKVTKYNDGTAIPLVTDNTAWSNLTTPGYCWYNNDAATNKNTYGGLYNFYTVNTGKLAPTGWHVPPMQNGQQWKTT